MSVIDDARQVADEFPTGEGFVVALANPMNVHQSCAQGMAKYRVLFLKKVDHTPPRPYIEGGVLANVIGGSLENAHIYPTWEAAAADARSWQHSNKVTTRVIAIRRHAPFELLEDSPITLLDALAQL
jgi:hypothetical protein